LLIYRATGNVVTIISHEANYQFALQNGASLLDGEDWKLDFMASCAILCLSARGVSILVGSTFNCIAMF
jgi:hypothetical protein